QVQQFRQQSQIVQKQMDISYIAYLLSSDYSKMSSTKTLVIFVFVMRPITCRPSFISFTTGRASICLSINFLASSINASVEYQTVIFGILVIIICTGIELRSRFPRLAPTRSCLDT